MLKDLFLLDPDVVFLNHGSFGACPRPVFEQYQAWQRRLEAQPVQFLGVELDEYLKNSRQILSDYLNTEAGNLVYIPNATYGVNIIAHSLNLSPADEILATDQEYGACNYVWEFYTEKSGANYKIQPIKFPVNSEEEILEQYWSGVTHKTKVLYLSHISSPTALTFPVKQICLRAREAGILTVIDGAHAPGQLSLDLTDMNADFYIGNCHKWMMSPKGAGFLYSRPEVQHLVEPLIVSWGFQSRSSKPKESIFIDTFQWTGTNDPSAALTVPSAIDFLETYHWPEIRVECHQLLIRALEKISELTKLPLLYPSNSKLFHQMATFAIPRVTEITELKSRLYTEFKIEIPCIEWNGQQYLRLSMQGYNTEQDICHLITALRFLLPKMKV